MKISKDKQRAIKNIPQGKTRVHGHTIRSKEDQTKYGSNYKEDAMIDAIDMLDELKKVAKMMEDLRNNKTDVQNFFQGIAPEAAIELVKIMNDPTAQAKIRLEAAKDLLNRAGYAPVNKHAVASFDADTPREAIMSYIKGAEKDIPELEIIEDDEEDTEDPY